MGRKVRIKTKCWKMEDLICICMVYILMVLRSIETVIYKMYISIIVKFVKTVVLEVIDRIFQSM